MQQLGKAASLALQLLKYKQTLNVWHVTKLGVSLLCFNKTIWRCSIVLNVCFYWEFNKLLSILLVQTWWDRTWIISQGNHTGAGVHTNHKHKTAWKQIRHLPADRIKSWIWLLTWQDWMLTQMDTLSLYFLRIIRSHLLIVWCHHGCCHCDTSVLWLQWNLKAKKQNWKSLWCMLQEWFHRKCLIGHLFTPFILQKILAYRVKSSKAHQNVLGLICCFEI